MTRFAKEWKQLSRAISYLSKADRVRVKKAFEFSVEMHGSAKRYSGEPYFVHPFKAALYLASLRLDASTLCAELLHDVLEDSDVSARELRKRFGKEVAELVEGVTKLRGVRKRKSETSLSQLRNLFLYGVRDKRVLLVKMADKLHNMQTLRSLPPKRRHRIALDCLQFYAPLAEKLGMQEIGYCFEDLSLQALNEKNYSKMKKQIDSLRRSKEIEISKMISVLRRKFPSAKFRAVPSSVYILSEKSKRSRKPLESLYDASVLYVFPKTESDCYKFLGALHALYPPLPQKFKDFIALPKNASYQALHSTVIGPKGKPVKVRIQTLQMFEISREGIAYCFSHKNAKSRELLKHFSSFLQTLARVEDKDSRAFVSDLEKQFAENIAVFSKSGELFELPQGSTVLDFAFLMSRDLGLKCESALVNGKSAPLWQELESGDRIVIRRSFAPCVEGNWAGFVKTERAREFLQRYCSVHRAKVKHFEPVFLEVRARDRVGLFAQTSQTISSLGVNILEAEAGGKGSNAFILFSLDAPPLLLPRIVKELKKVEGVRAVSVRPR
ncbi:MAG: HD domain-containing protein [Candidatus Diapherotrites archaeon]